MDYRPQYIGIPINPKTNWVCSNTQIDVTDDVTILNPCKVTSWTKAESFQKNQDKAVRNTNKEWLLPWVSHIYPVEISAIAFWFRLESARFANQRWVSREIWFNTWYVYQSIIKYHHIVYRLHSLGCILISAAEICMMWLTAHMFAWIGIEFCYYTQ